MPCQRTTGRVRSVILVMAMLLLWPQSGVAEDATPKLASRVDVERLLDSPLAADRLDAERRAVARGPIARPWARAWIQERATARRVAGWAVLSQVGTDVDLRAAVTGMSDGQPAVRAVAAEAVVALAERLPPSGKPWLPAGSVSADACPVLAAALARRLGESVNESLPVAVFRTGEGAIDALRLLSQSEKHAMGVREAAIESLARIGGEQARAALAALASDDDMVRREVWWKSLLEVGNGKAMRPVHELVERWSEAALLRSSGWRGGPVREPRPLGWRTRVPFYRFLVACPPPDPRGQVAGYLEARLAACASRRGRVPPSMVVEIVRAYLVMCDPDDDALENAIEAASEVHGRGWRRREELGDVLAALEVYREREAVQEAVRDLLEEGALPRTVEAWAQYLVGGTPADDVRASAIALLQLEGDAATLAQRRSGARLLDRVGGPDGEILRTLLDDVDPWLRAWALSRALQAKHAGLLSPVERAAAMAAGLDDKNDRVFLVAARACGSAAGAAQRARVEHLALQGPRAMRILAWKALAAWLSAEAAAAWAPPASDASLDARLEAQAGFRALVPAAPIKEQGGD